MSQPGSSMGRDRATASSWPSASSALGTPCRRQAPECPCCSLCTVTCTAVLDAQHFSKSGPKVFAVPNSLLQLPPVSCRNEFKLKAKIGRGRMVMRLRTAHPTPWIHFCRLQGHPPVGNVLVLPICCSWVRLSVLVVPLTLLLSNEQSTSGTVISKAEIIPTISSPLCGLEFQVPVT